jgi:hypothetical protein
VLLPLKGSSRYIKPIVCFIPFVPPEWQGCALRRMQHRQSPRLALFSEGREAGFCLGFRLHWKCSRSV